ncbi:carboxymuconolactone decarboxylase family protein [Rhodococcus sp. ACS1]|uniref:carboxymuconolactone decarboxylase family protein n=1 Tax=Rhodococcus sp. ACS1 TaxID=2028570 RepID=UPI00117989FD|nr:carboxymuconolactone decarboxylase family protein [Rhodococcus sp. ACS1]
MTPGDDRVAQASTDGRTVDDPVKNLGEAGDRRTTYEKIMVTTKSGGSPSVLMEAGEDFLFDQVWTRPGLSIRERRLITLSCIAAVGAAKPMAAHVAAALESGDLTREELEEAALQCAAYVGWPAASLLDQAIRQHAPSSS